MPEEKSKILWDVLAALLLTISITMLADFARRLLSADPDSLGIAAIALQAAPALVASSSFTDTGWEWLKKQGHDKARRRFYLAAVVFALVAVIWQYLPGALAQHYLARGYGLEHPQAHGYPDPSEALRDYQRAVALDPGLQPAYFNLGVVLEDFYRYDEAEVEYKKAMVADDNNYEHKNTRDPRPYNNLARDLVADGKPLVGLHVAEDGLALLSTDADTVSSLKKNKAWAELELGFYDDALKDATSAGGAAGDCILGKTYAKMGRADDAKVAWAKFTKDSTAVPSSVSVIQPDCQLLAEVSNAKK